jgi:2-methylcitrate dehydratase PrpD
LILDSHDIRNEPAIEMGEGCVNPEKSTTAGAADRLAAFAAQLAYDGLPAEVILNAKLCLIDAVACAVFGTGFSWSRAVIDLIASSASTGGGAVPEFARRLDPRQAALAFGTFAHAFELDSLRKPGVGAHPGATVALPAFAMAQAGKRSGRDLIVAIVAGCETSFRIGAATLHTPELDGFHAPGIVGPFGSAVASGRLLGLSPAQLAAAIGIAGSCTGGLLAFAASGSGGMVKRLHLGRAAESGVLAAMLAARGYEGPRTILDGKFGILQAFCSRSEPALLTARLGEFFEITRLCIKRYACHVTAQAPIELLRTMMTTHRFGAAEIAAIRLITTAKVASHHSERRPADVMLGQYSVPFSLAVAAWRDPEDPMAFAAGCVRDPAILDLAARIEVAAGDASGWGAQLSVTLRDGRNFAGRGDTFRGCPETPMSIEEVAAKFRKLTGAARRCEALLLALLDVENIADVATLEF